jgi:hypothetical protein
MIDGSSVYWGNLIVGKTWRVTYPRYGMLGLEVHAAAKDTSDLTSYVAYSLLCTPLSAWSP